MTEQSLCALDTQTHMYILRFISAQRIETNLAMSPTHSNLQYELSSSSLLPRVSVLYVCLCRSNALYKVERRQLPWGLWPNMVLFRVVTLLVPHWFSAALSLQGSKIICNRSTRWSGKRGFVSLSCVITGWKEKCCPVTGEPSMWKQMKNGN